jgi:hypothetical protein
LSRCGLSLAVGSDRQGGVDQEVALGDEILAGAGNGLVGELRVGVV